MTRVGVVALLGAAVLVACGAGWGQSVDASTGQFPTYFHPDDGDKGFEQAGPPSNAVLDALLASKEAVDAESELRGKSRDELRALFRVAPIQLGPRGEQDFLAQGKGPLTGADCDWFWIVRVRDGHARVLLFVNGLAVTLENHRASGYRDVRGDWGTAAFTGMGIFRYDGRVYKLVRTKSWENRP